MKKGMIVEKNRDYGFIYCFDGLYYYFDMIDVDSDDEIELEDRVIFNFGSKIVAENTINYAFNINKEENNECSRS